MNETGVHVELALQAALRRGMDAVVRAANTDAALLENSGMDKNQIRNVLNVAEESRSLAVVTNFIRYQMGRSQTGPAWRHPPEGQSFGLRVIEQIESPDGIVAKQAQVALVQAQKQAGDIPQEAADDLRYDLARYYLGYLNRAFYYGRETKKWKDLRQAGEET
jgi:hypothetical protein